MKLSVIICLAGMLQATASIYSQNTRFNVTLREQSIKDVFREIEKQSEYHFLYNDDYLDLDRHVNLNMEGSRLEEILGVLFQGADLSYQILDNNLVVITPANLAQSQMKRITGTVTDAYTNEPLPGVYVMVKGTNTGAISDALGKYSIDVPDSETILTFSFIGYMTENVPVGDELVLDIQLTPDIQALEEVVVIGYGTVKKSDLTGAVGSVQGDALVNRQTTQISQALQGALPGVTVTRDNNAPGSSATIRIRGVTTIGESSPLIIVDGVPVDNINDINPNDIQNISVLKDAASASIYGSRAAAGVILVTTNRAKTDEMSLEYNFEYGFERPTEMAKYVDAVRYMEMVNELRWNDNGNGLDEYPTYDQSTVENYLSLHDGNPDQYPITDWVDLILEEKAPRQSHNLSLSAGTKAVRSKVSLGYDKTDGLFMGKSYERFTARFNNDVVINSFISASLDFYAKRSIAENPSMDPIYYMRISAPVYAAEWSNGLVAEGKSGGNIYGQIKYGGYDNYWYNQVGGKLSLDITPVKGLKLTATISPKIGVDKGKKFLKKVAYTDYDNPDLEVSTLQWAKTNSLTETRYDNYRVTAQVIANYIKSFGNHNLNMMAGYENYHAFDESLSAASDQLELSSYPYLDLGNANYLSNGGSAYENAYRSYFGRIMYNYGNRYYLQGNIRYDGSSRFDKAYRWGAFPSFSLGWVISEESFMKSISVLSFLKLRASWGTLGNERIGNYPYQSTIAFGNALFYQGSNVVSSQTAAQTQYAIRDISWETTESWDFGLDASLLNSRLRFTGDLYKKTTKDMLLELEIPDFLGFDNPDQNTGKMYTTGWEFELGWNDQVGKLRYGIAFNMSDSRTVMGNLGGIEFLGEQVKYDGSEFNEWYGYQSEGLFQTADEVSNSAVLNSNVKPGDVKYKDISGPDGVPDGKITADYDRVLLGGSLPRYVFGGNINLGYKNLDFSLSFQGVGKQNSRVSAMMAEPLLENWGSIPELIDGKYWSNYNTEEQNLAAKYPRLSYTSVGNNYTMSDYWLFNGAYFRLKNITVGYSLPNNFIEKSGLKSIRIYGSITDMVSLNNYPRGWDPEVSGSGYPITASFVFGASVKF